MRCRSRAALAGAWRHVGWLTVIAVGLAGWWRRVVDLWPYLTTRGH